jgi:hypothetical protein
MGRYGGINLNILRGHAQNIPIHIWRPCAKFLFFNFISVFVVFLLRGYYSYIPSRECDFARYIYTALEVILACDSSSYRLERLMGSLLYSS